VNEESAGQGEQGTASVGIILGPGEGRTVPGADTLSLKATSEQTGGSIGVLEATSPPGYGPPPIFTIVQTSYSTCSRESFSSWSASERSVRWPGRSSSSRAGRFTPPRSSGPGLARCLRPTYLEAWSDPSKSSLGCAPSREKMRVEARDVA
jgi:hypothetical protein